MIEGNQYFEVAQRTFAAIVEVAVVVAAKAVGFVVGAVVSHCQTYYAQAGADYGDSDKAYIVDEALGAFDDVDLDAAVDDGGAYYADDAYLDAQVFVVEVDDGGSVAATNDEVEFVDDVE